MEWNHSSPLAGALRSGSFRSADPLSRRILQPDPFFPRYVSRIPVAVDCTTTVTSPLVMVSGGSGMAAEGPAVQSTGKSAAMIRPHITVGPAG